MKVKLQPQERINPKQDLKKKTMQSKHRWDSISPLYKHPGLTINTLMKIWTNTTKNENEFMDSMANIVQTWNQTLHKSTWLFRMQIQDSNLEKTRRLKWMRKTYGDKVVISKRKAGKEIGVKILFLDVRQGLVHKPHCVTNNKLRIRWQVLWAKKCNFIQFTYFRQISIPRDIAQWMQCTCVLYAWLSSAVKFILYFCIKNLRAEKAKEKEPEICDPIWTTSYAV